MLYKYKIENNSSLKRKVTYKNMLQLYMLKEFILTDGVTLCVKAKPQSL